MKALRPWCAICQFEGRQPFYVGTEMIDARAPDHEVRLAIIALLTSVLPDGSPMPERIDPVAGSIVFQPEGEA